MIDDVLEGTEYLIFGEFADRSERTEIVRECETRDEAEEYLNAWCDPSGQPMDFEGNWMLGHYKRLWIEKLIRITQ